MNRPTFPLTDQIDITSGAHILYYYSDRELYLDNAAAFLEAGLKLDQHTVLVESEEHRREIMNRLRGKFEEDALRRIHFVDHSRFYCEYGVLHIENIMEKFSSVFDPYIREGGFIRSWGNVYWERQEDIFEQLERYEHQCDRAVSDIGMLGVCAYDGRRVPARIQNEMLRTHEYFMTDTTLTKSMLYEKTGRKVVFPSLSIHQRMQSEVDFYKQKLDFVNVISHEVRNPLTVINAYASLLMDESLTDDGRRKLEAIIDYVKVIDNEIGFLIHTEQLLSTEALWNKAPLRVRPVAEEVAAIMETKSRTQNVGLECRLDIDEEKIAGHRIGLKLLLMNMLGNAIKYSEERDRVILDVSRASDRLSIAVADEGVGMSRAKLEQLRRTFKKLKDEERGRGTGLFMVQYLADHFEGELTIETEPGRGTTIVVTIPLVHDE